MATSSSSATGVCLLYMGGPTSLEGVEPFLRELFSDREMIRLPGGRWLQRPFAALVSRLRAPKVRGRYGRIGGGSPLVRITQSQAALLERSLARHGDFAVTVAMRYSRPRAEEAVAHLVRRGIHRLVALPLYPHYSSATTGSSLNDLDRAVQRLRPDAPMEVERVRDFHDHPLYIQALAGTVRRGLEQLGGEATVLFSAHSIPLRLVERGDPYRDQVERTVALVAQELELTGWQLGYQSRSGPVRWLEPNVLELLNRLGQAGTERLLVVPVSFVSDHIETLHEVDIEMREHALAAGVREFARAPALNEDATFIEALTRIALSTCQRSPSP
jgi:ferrochelatase